MKLGIKPKTGSPVEQLLRSKQREESLAEASETCKMFLREYTKYVEEGKFVPHGAFILLWNFDGTYIQNDAGMFPSATFVGLLELFKQGLIARHYMSMVELPPPPEKK